MIMSNNQLMRIHAGSLTVVEGGVTINTQAFLTEVSFPALVSVGGVVNIHDNTNLTAVSAGQLEVILGEVNIFGNRLLRIVKLPSLHRVGDALQIYNNNLLMQINANLLVHVEGLLSIHTNPFLSSAAFDSLMPLLGCVGAQQLDQTDGWSADFADRVDNAILALADGLEPCS